MIRHAIGLLALALGSQACQQADAARVPRDAATVDAGPAIDLAAASRAAGDAGDPPPPNDHPFGPGVPIARYTCPTVQRGGPFRSYLASADTRVAFVDGDDPTAIVNRSPTGALPPDYTPGDLVDVHDGKPHTAAECEGGRECLRADAAAALHRMSDAMRAEGMEARVQSAYRSFATQCWVFASWAHQARGGFCEATEQSALPGHSQHQLGTTLDLFTREWADQGSKNGQGVFRNGFGCTRGGTWIDENSWKYGFVVSYPIHPDDRRDGSRCVARSDRPVPINPKTGYKNEPWHLRFVGVEAAARYHTAWLASGPGTPGEITLEQWLRSGRRIEGDAELPVCDGCQCGACATLATDDARAPCGKASLQLDGEGRVVSPPSAPHLLSVSVLAGTAGAFVVDAVVDSPAHTPTQPPIFGTDDPGYSSDATYLSVEPSPGLARRGFPELRGAWRIVAAPERAGAVPEPATPHGQRPDASTASDPRRADAPPAGDPRRADASVPPSEARAWPWRASLAAPELAATWNRADVVLPARAGEAHVRFRVSPPAGTRALSVALLVDGVAHEERSVPLP